MCMGGWMDDGWIDGLMNQKVFNKSGLLSSSPNADGPNAQTQRVTFCVYWLQLECCN